MNRLKNLRTRAFYAQSGRCCYCDLPMWQVSPDELKPLGLRVRAAGPLRCTAEHLVARQDGGKEMAGNIAAACWSCNSRRHRLKSPPLPEAYRLYVQRRLTMGRWHPPILARLRATPPLPHEGHEQA